MNITIENNTITINDENRQAGYIKFNKINETTIDVYTTFVDPECRGMGIAGKLFDALVKYCREENYKIVPHCSYIKNKLEKSKEFDDVYARNV